MTEKIIRLVGLSDTHGMHQQVQVPRGNILIHCGDLTARGQYEEFADFITWFAEQPHDHKVVVPGNHDGACESNLNKCRELVAQHPDIHMLVNEEATILGLKLYGSPVTPRFGNWHFMENRGEPIRQTWKRIPKGTDILITHGPPYGHGDLAPAYRSQAPRLAGCLELLRRVKAIRPKLHIFGHIHDGYGRTQSDEMPTMFVNTSICTEQYQPTNPPQVIDIRVSK